MNTLDPATVEALREIAVVLRDTASAIGTLAEYETNRAEDAPDWIFEELTRAVKIMRESRKKLEDVADEFEILE